MRPPEAPEEAVRLKIGGPTILSAEIPIRGSVLGPLTSLFRRTPHDQLIHVVGGSAIVHVNEDDAGSVDFYGTLVNMTDREVHVEHLYLEYVWFAGYSSHVAQPLFTPPTDPVPPRALAEIRVSVSLGAATIRDVMTRIQKPSNGYSSARVELTVGGRLGMTVEGRLTALQRRRHLNLPFKVVVRQPELNFSNPSSRT